MLENLRHDQYKYRICKYVAGSEEKTVPLGKTKHISYLDLPRGAKSMMFGVPIQHQPASPRVQTAPFGRCWWFIQKKHNENR